MSALARFATLALLAPWALAACDGCRGERPYTPFGVTSALPAKTPSATPPAASASAPAPLLTSKKAVFAPPLARRFRVGERELEAPPTRVFEQALALAPLDGAAPAVVAWTLAEPGAEPAGSPGELWLFPPSGEARRLLEFPGFLPTGAGCRYTTALASSTEPLVTIDVETACSEALLARAPTRALVVIDPSAARPFRFGLRASAPAPGERFPLELTPRDEDADGRPDYRLEAALSLGSAAPLASATFVWLERAAGVSRDAREPGRGLADTLGRELARAQRKKSAAQSLERVDATRRLLGAVCAEGAAARVFDWEGAPLRCGPLGAVVDRLASVEVAAHLALADIVSASAVLARDGWYFGALGASQKKSLTQEIEKKLTPVPAARVALGVRPRAARPGFPSPLAFDATGALLVQTDSGLYRLDAESAREVRVEPDAGVAAWPLGLDVGGGAELVTVSYSCDRSEIGLLTSTGATRPLAVLAPRPGACGGRAFDDRFPPSPAGGREKPAFIVGGALTAVLGEKPALAGHAGAPGSARSPDGRWLAIPSPLGLLIAGARHEIWKIDGWDGVTPSGCVVDDAAARAACVRGGRAELYLKSPAPE